MKQVTPAEWAKVHPDHKTVLPNGSTWMLVNDAQAGTVLERVEVVR